MKDIPELLSYDNPVLCSYVFWSAILVLKILAMPQLTLNRRNKHKVVQNPEDVGFIKDPTAKPIHDNEEVERVRRAHRNDLENCLPFMFIGLFYVMTNPSAVIAINLFRVAVISRIIHTVAYVHFTTQPTRAISWSVCYFATIYMSVKTLMFFM